MSSCHTQKSSSNVIIGMLKLFCIDTYDLLDLDANLFFVTVYNCEVWDLSQTTSRAF